jgi:hypothetical protein
MRLVTDLPLLFSRADAAGHGLARARFDRWRLRGDLVQVAPGLFAEAVRWHLTDREERHVALSRAAAARYDGAAVSHASAVLLWGLPAPRHLPARPQLTVAKRVHASDDSDWCRVLRCALPDRHVERRQGVLVTTLARTAVDCFRSLPLADALAVADAVVSRGVTPGELVGVRKEQARWPNIGRARLGLGLVDGRRESWLESASVAGLFGLLPRPVPQVDVLDHGEHLGRVDLLWRALRVVGEADGRGKFRGDFDADTSQAAVAERLIRADVRARRLEEAGLGVVRWGTAQLRRPGALAARIRDAAPSRPLRAVLRCATCREELDGCRCAPRLCLPDR